MNNNGYYTGYQNTNIGTSSGYPNAAIRSNSRHDRISYGTILC